jgi:hypothetical protein
MPQDGARADDVRQTYHALHTTIAARDGSWMAYHLPPSDMSFLEIEQERRRTPRWWPESIASEEARNAERVVARSALREAARPSVPNVVVRRIDPTD